MDVFWLEQSEADLPAGDDWLSAGEVDRLTTMRVPKRRADWRLGRWTAKRALSAYLNLPGHHQALTDIEIRPAPSGAPEAFIANRPASAAISLSHCNGNAICAVAAFGTALGCDLELVEPRSDAFVADYFTVERARACCAGVRCGRLLSPNAALERQGKRAQSAPRGAST